MILVRRTPSGTADDLTLEEFERRAQNGEIAPHHQVCFPAVTGTAFVAAGSLELYRGLYASGLITFRRYFHLARMPWMTVGVIATLCLTYVVWQEGPPVSTNALIEQGAKSPVLMLELAQWWRLVTANLLHISAWHLAANALFMFNLGGPTEAVFRRTDYAVLLVASALGTTLLSALANPTVSCGASGIVFGVWGAAAVFGVRHRELLPDRYRRYFIGSVIPYAVFALYLGFAIPGVDNWGHLGGLIAGSTVALFLPSRLLAPRDTAAPLKLFAMGLAALLIAGLSLLPAGAGELTSNRYYPRSGLAVSIPARWQRASGERGRQVESYVFDNGAGVTVGIQARQHAVPIPSEGVGRRFVETELSSQLQRAGVQGMRVNDPLPATLGSLPAERVDAEVVTADLEAHATYVIAARGYYHYVVSLTTPLWLRAAYQETQERVLASVKVVEPDELLTAGRRLEQDDSPVRHAQLATALAHAGDALAARTTLESARLRWPDNGDLSEASARLLVEAGSDALHACDLVSHALAHKRWTPALLLLGIDAHLRCGRHDTAARLAADGVERFPDDGSLQQRLEEVGAL